MATLFVYRNTRPKNLNLLMSLSVILAVLAGISFWGAHHSSAASCTTNDIMRCGFTTPSDFISKVEANNNGINSSADLQAIYAHYGLSQADYSNFAAHAVQGEAMRDGSIVVNGKVVGKGGMSIGRLKSYQGSGPFAVAIAGHTYYGNTNSQAFASGVTQIPVFVLLDSGGSMKFAVMPACGNPEFPTSKPAPTIQPSAACRILNSQSVEGKQNTFSFTAAATNTGGATITKYVYDFGDGSQSVTETNGDTQVTHTYNTSGTFTAKVTVFASISGAEKQLPVVVTCTKQITIAAPQQPAPTPTPTPPPVPEQPVPSPTPQPTTPVLTADCRDLVALPTDNNDNKMSFTFTATAAQHDGLKLSGADFDFGDGTTQQDVAVDSSGNTVTISKSFASSGTFTVSAILHFIAVNDQNNMVTSAPCTTVVTPAATVAVATVPLPTPPTTPPAAQTSVSTTTLPNTGAGDVIGLFFVITAIGTFIFRMILLRSTKSSN